MSRGEIPPTDSGPVPLDISRRRKVTFDPTINLGHVLTFLGFMTSGAIAYFDLRERIAVHDVRIQQIDAESGAEKLRIREALKELRDDVRETRRGVEDLARRKP